MVVRFYKAWEIIISLESLTGFEEVEQIEYLRVSTVPYSAVVLVVTNLRVLLQTLARKRATRSASQSINLLANLKISQAEGQRAGAINQLARHSANLLGSESQSRPGDLDSTSWSRSPDTWTLDIRVFLSPSRKKCRTQLATGYKAHPPFLYKCTTYSNPATCIKHMQQANHFKSTLYRFLS